MERQTKQSNAKSGLKRCCFTLTVHVLARRQNWQKKRQRLGILYCAQSQCVVICRVKMCSIHVQGSKCAISQVTVLGQLLFVTMYRFEPYWHLSLPVRAGWTKTARSSDFFRSFYLVTATHLNSYNFSMALLNTKHQ